jgi:hypothetical protein
MDSASPTVLRIQSTAAFGAARIEMWSEPQTSTNEWRPGYIQSFDNGSYTGGLAFFTNGTGQAQRQGSVEAMRVVNGRVGVSVPNPDYVFEVGGRIRLHDSPPFSSGLWLRQASADRSFIGMVSNTVVGMWGEAGHDWFLQMDTGNGNLGVRTAPAASGGAALTVNGRIRDSRAPTEARNTNQVSISALNDASGYSQIPDMSATVNVPVGGWFYVRFRMNGVQMQVSNVSPNHGHGDFRLIVDGNVVDSTREEWHNSGWELRGVSLERLLQLNPGSHTISVQWQVGSDQAHAAIPPFVPEARVTLTGCWYNDNRSLICIEL